MSKINRIKNINIIIRSNSDLLTKLIAYQMAFLFLYTFVSRVHLVGQMLLVIHFLFIIYLTLHTYNVKNTAVYWIFIFALTLLLISQFVIETARFSEGYWNANIHALLTPLSIHVIFGYLHHYSFSWEQIKKVAWIHLGYVLFACFYNLVVNFVPMTSWILSGLSSSPGVGAYTYNFASFFGNRNGFGVWLFAATISLAMIYRKPKTSFFIILAVLMGSLLLTLSRASMLGVAVFVAIVGLMSDMFSKKAKMLLIVLGVIVIALLLSTPSTRAWINDFIIFRGYRTEQIHTSERTEIITSAVAYLNNNNGWLWGFGKGQVGVIGANELGFTEFHNAYIDVVMANGVIVLIAYTALIIVSFCNAVKVYKYDKHLGAVFAAGIVSFAVYALFESFQFMVMAYQTWIPVLYIYCFPKMYLNSFEHYPLKLVHSIVPARRLHGYT